MGHFPKQNDGMVITINQRLDMFIAGTGVWAKFIDRLLILG